MKFFDSSRRILMSRCTRIALAVALALPAASFAQVPRDDIDRNLQERAVREREFHVDLDAPPPSIVPPSPALERSRVMLPTPGTELFEVPSHRPARATQGAVVSPGPRVGGATLLDESQRRRQLELQSQTRFLDETQRRPLLESQRLQFEQEQRADQVHSDIMRNSERAMRGR